MDKHTKYADHVKNALGKHFCITQFLCCSFRLNQREEPPERGLEVQCIRQLKRASVCASAVRKEEGRNRLYLMVRYAIRTAACGMRLSGVRTQPKDQVSVLSSECSAIRALPLLLKVNWQIREPAESCLPSESRRVLR